MKIDYKSAGVDIDKGDALVDWIRDQPALTAHKEDIVSGVGGFASLFRLSAIQGMQSPCLVTCTDGVGTKVRLGVDLGIIEPLGQDLVAMCVNDMACTGAEPLLFLDYYATGELRLDPAKAFLTGVRKACEASGMALVGGETAEMPGVYAAGDFDCAGFAVGVVDESQAWGPQRVQAGDVLVGVASSGFHSNGYSLVRKLFEGDSVAWAERLMTPTHLYARLASQARQKKMEIHSAAHITGGGIDNLLRALPSGMGAEIRSWPWPEIFLEAQKRSQLSSAEMLRTFNCGLGFVFVLNPKDRSGLMELIDREGFQAFDLGRVQPQNPGLHWQE